MSTRSWLFRALEELAIDFAVRETPAGAPYAGFRMVGPEGRSRSLTVLEQDQVLRLSSHGVPALPLSELMALTRVTPVGRAFLLPDEALADFVVGCYVGVGISADQLGVLLDHAGVAVDAVEGRVSAPPWPAIAPEAAISMVDLAEALERRGTPRVMGESVQADFPMDGEVCRIDAAPAPGGWISVRGSWDALPPASDDEGVWWVLQQLQNWTVAGRYLVLPDNQLVVEVSTPVVDADVARCADWTLSQATLMLQVARRHLPS